MFHNLRQLVGLFIFTILFGAVLSSPVRALPVTVGGITYDVVFFQGPTTRAANIGTIDDAPWWGSETLATDFATQYFAQQGSSAFNLTDPPTFPDNDRLVFVFANSGNSQIELEQDGTVDGPFTAFGDGLEAYHFAYVNAAAPVPEIDGGALGQAAMILLALWLVIRQRGGAGLRRVAVREGARDKPVTAGTPPLSYRW